MCVYACACIFIWRKKSYIWLKRNVVLFCQTYFFFIALWILLLNCSKIGDVEQANILTTPVSPKCLTIIYIYIFTIAGVKDNILIILIWDCMTPLLHWCWCLICGNMGLINTIKLNMPVFILWCWSLHYCTPSHPTTGKPHQNCLVLTVPVQY